MAGGQGKNRGQLMSPNWVYSCSRPGELCEPRRRVDRRSDCLPCRPPTDDSLSVRAISSLEVRKKPGRLVMLLLFSLPLVAGAQQPGSTASLTVTDKQAVEKWSRS